MGGFLESGHKNDNLKMEPSSVVKPLPPDGHVLHAVTCLSGTLSFQASVVPNLFSGLYPPPPPIQHDIIFRKDVTHSVVPSVSDSIIEYRTFSLLTCTYILLNITEITIFKGYLMDANFK